MKTKTLDGVSNVLVDGGATIILYYQRELTQAVKLGILNTMSDAKAVPTNILTPSVCVMMSVYNGARYLREQIDSILDQEGVDVRLIVRDDGSTDDTLKILRSYGEKLVSHRGQNLGAAQGFLEVASLAPKDITYYSFSDADDVWLPRKLASAIVAIQDAKGPAIVTARLRTVNEHLQPIGLSYKPKAFSFANALVQCVLSGAGSLMNKEMFETFVSGRPRTLEMHDAWLYLCATAFGTIYFQENPQILYRQHGSNVFGAGGAQSTRAVWKRRWRSLTKGDRKYREQAEEFLRIHGDKLRPEDHKLATRFVSHNRCWLSRAKFAIRPGVQFTSFKSRALYSMRALLNRT